MLLDLQDLLVNKHIKDVQKMMHILVRHTIITSIATLSREENTKSSFVNRSVPKTDVDVCSSRIHCIDSAVSLYAAESRVLL